MPEFDAEDFAEGMRNRVIGQGFSGWSGYRLSRVEAGQVRVDLTVRPEMLQHHGFVHGGVVGALADVSCAWAASSAVGDVVTQSYTLQLLAPAQGEHLYCDAVVIKAGRRNVTVEAKVFVANEGDERLVAVALASIARLDGQARAAA